MVTAMSLFTGSRPAPTEGGSSALSPPGAAAPETGEELDRIWRALGGVIDPELGVPVTDLGLIYGVEVDGSRVRVVMTTTTPICPLGSYLQQQVERQLSDHVVTVDIVHEPLWTPDRMNDRARQLLGWDPR